MAAGDGPGDRWGVDRHPAHPPLPRLAELEEANARVNRLCQASLPYGALDIHVHAPPTGDQCASSAAARWDPGKKKIVCP